MQNAAEQAKQTEQTTQTTQRDTEKERNWAEFVAKQRREDLLRACRLAVESLEGFAAKARRQFDLASEDEGTGFLELPNQVMSACTWGAANASTSLCGATKTAGEYMKALGKLEALKAGE